MTTDTRPEITIQTATEQLQQYTDNLFTETQSINSQSTVMYVGGETEHTITFTKYDSGECRISYHHPDSPFPDKDTILSLSGDPELEDLSAGKNDVLIQGFDPEKTAEGLLGLLQRSSDRPLKGFGKAALKLRNISRG